jgi:hypothetical protein
MNSKEKAKELWTDFLGCLIRTSNTYTDNGFIEEQAKQCALIAVDEILNNYYKNHFQTGKKIDYWKEVKKEIELL